MSILTITNFPASPHLADPRLVMKDRFLWDGEALDVMKNISKVVPNNSTLMVSDYQPIFEYGTGLKSKTPNNTSSALTIHNFAISRHSKYLVVVEHDWDPTKIWGTPKINSLIKYFDEIASYKTDIFKIHLFKTKITGGSIRE